MYFTGILVGFISYTVPDAAEKAGLGTNGYGEFSYVELYLVGALIVEIILGRKLSLFSIFCI